MKLYKMTIAMVLAGLLCAGVQSVSAQETSSTKQPSAREKFAFSIGVGGALNAHYSSFDKSDWNGSSLGSSPFIFADAKYGEIGIGMLIDNVQNSKIGSPTFPVDNALGMTFSAMLKYPFTINKNFDLFPLLGAEYSLYFTPSGSDTLPVDKDGGTGSATEALSNIMFKLGLGFDTYLNDNWFIRTEIAYGIGVPSKLDNAIKDASGSDWALSHGGSFKIAAGYRF
jgi:opacity protein-like surface antigen